MKEKQQHLPLHTLVGTALVDPKFLALLSTNLEAAMREIGGLTEEEMEAVRIAAGETGELQEFAQRLLDILEIRSP